MLGGGSSRLVKLLDTHCPVCVCVWAYVCVGVEVCVGGGNEIGHHQYRHYSYTYVILN